MCQENPGVGPTDSASQALLVILETLFPALKATVSVCLLVFSMVTRTQYNRNGDDRHPYS